MNGSQHMTVGIGFGIAGAYAVIHGMNEPLGISILLGSAVGCMLPDIDHDRTKIGRKRKVVSDATQKLINTTIYGGIALGTALALGIIFGFVNYGIDLSKLFVGIIGLGVIAILKNFVVNSKSYKWATKHRGLMHTLVVPVLLYYLTTVSSAPLYYYIIWGLLIGYCSHLFADMLTVEGCPVLFPLSRNNIRFMTLRTKDKSCTYASWLVFLGVIAISIMYF